MGDKQKLQDYFTLSELGIDPKVTLCNSSTTDDIYIRMAFSSFSTVRYLCRTIQFLR